ncbi:MAG: GtrA family protein [Hyphomonas sp.]
MSAKLREQVRQLATFGLVGITATAVHYGAALALSQLMPLAWANPLGFVAAFGVSYLGHLKLTFRVAASESRHATRLSRFLAVALLGLLAGQTMLLTLSKTGRLEDWQTLLVSVAIIPVVTFIISRVWVFRSSAPENPAPRA